MTRDIKVGKTIAVEKRTQFVFCIILTGVMLFFSSPIKEAVIGAIRLCAYNVIPTLFPFFILADLWVISSQDSTGLISRIFEKIFRINGCAASAFITGIICGFPLGARTAVRLYERGLVSREELRDLCAFINNPSAAFVISGVGMGIHGSLSAGVLLYISILLSALLMGVLLRKKHQKSKKQNEISEQKFDLVESIKGAAFSSISISAYIIFFSGVIGIVSFCFKNLLVLLVFSAFSEVSNATVIIADILPKGNILTLCVTAFALGFSGFSVHLQTFSFLPKELSRSHYILMKLIEGALAAMITAILCTLFLR